MNIEDNAIPVIAVRDIVAFPNTIVPLFVGRKQSINAINHAFSKGQSVLMVTQKKAHIEDVKLDNLYKYGVLANIVHVAKTGKAEMKVIVDIYTRTRIESFIQGETMLRAVCHKEETDNIAQEDAELLVRALKNTFVEYVENTSAIPVDIVATVAQIEDPEVYIDIVSSTLPTKVEKKMDILQELDLTKRVTKITHVFNNEIKLSKLESKIQGKVRQNISKSQQEHYLREQIDVLQKELNTVNGKGADGAEKYEKLLKKLKAPKDVMVKVEEEVTRMKSLSSYSSETSIIKTYLDWIFSLPWGVFSHKKMDAKKAEGILNRDHYGLEKIKERILEYIAVYARIDKPRGQILCLYGPPGVGKTSIVSSIAEAMGKKYARISLGGMKDEAEIRGHRKTYIGAFPGKIVSAIKKAGTMNPVILLDEIDKLSDGHRGDPSSALLEVLDPEQNKAFQDNYLEVDFDLSNVTFIATANSLNISQPLMDRMELVNVSGYTELEKVQIAKNYITPEALTEIGLKKGELQIVDGAILSLINHYTRESGVRNLKQNIFKISRKALVKILKGEEKACKITEENIQDYLGVAKYEHGEREGGKEVGVTTGLAYTSAGGDILSIEAIKIANGKGEIKFTGKLGDVMKESMEIAFAYLKSHVELYGVSLTDIQKHNIHIHVPEGATPKDGPSAGVTIVTSLISLFKNIPVKNTIAMTGEITLQGKVLPIGGLKEKLMSAVRSKITEVCIPAKNEKDLEDVPSEIKDKLKIYPVSHVSEVIKLALNLNEDVIKENERGNLS